MTAAPFTTSSSDSTASDFATFGAVHLEVTDVERALGFWRDLIGLELLDRDGQSARLGAGGRALVVLHPGASRSVVRNASGLYHLALHVPGLAEYARVLSRIRASGYFQFPRTGHTHLADYIDDPDGIGLELALEAPPPVQVLERGPNEREMIDLEWLASHVPDGDTRPGLPAGTFIGHMHLRVADGDAALAFYRDMIGFRVNNDGRPTGMFDMSARGSFPHRLACNTWESAGQPQRPADAAGMRYFTLHLRSDDDLAAILARLATAGRPVERHGADAIVADPFGTRLLLTTSAAD
ncbi:MAG: VOC family protein [Chloroflexi bacterium]|nr:VOC family protein [Chloroflexota bacterium]